MKCAIVIADGVTQIMFTPETKNETDALKMITADDDISVEIKEGNFYSGFHHPQSLRKYNVALCQGGYVRAFEDKDSLMLVLKPKKEEPDQVSEPDAIDGRKPEGWSDYIQGTTC